jgi:leader peptidase (prepilin peptidase)/N-methyltransferase
MNDSVLALGLAALLGLMIGSFLNVVIHRLPLMLQAQWDTPPDEAPPSSPPFNLAVPRSHCPHCQHALAWHENIPLLSFIRLRGRCAHCQAQIAWRYPAIELVTSALFMWAAAAHGLGFQALVWAGFAAALVALAAIDADTRLLPDAITQPLAWAGLIATSLGLTGIGLNEALWGAAAGYLFLWTVYWLFKAVTGKEGMGQGDFKLLAALGAWLGWQMILPIVLGASVIGAVVGIAMKMSANLREGRYVPFGPFLAGGGLFVLFAGHERVMGWLGWA